MFKQKISIFLNSDVDRIKVYDEFEILMSNLVKNGQIIGGSETSFISGNELISFQTSLEEDSLSADYFNHYTKERIEKIENWCGAKIKYEVIGQIPSGSICTCAHSESYILFTTALNDSGQLDCGTCGKVVPLYRLKQLSSEDRSDIIAWESDYKSCDSLQLGCAVGERWATKQMSDYRSQLSQYGLQICTRIREVTGVQTFYYLHNYRHISHRKDIARLCPSCNGPWLLKEQWLGYYDFKCDKCSLLSVLSPVTA